MTELEIKEHNRLWYKKTYDSLIEKGKLRGNKKSELDYYTESHHIIPKCMGGTDEENAVRSLPEAVARQPHPGKQFSSSSQWSGTELTSSPCSFPTPVLALSASPPDSLLICLSWSEMYHSQWLVGEIKDPSLFSPSLDLCPSPDPELMYLKVKSGCSLPLQVLPDR